MKVQKKGMAQKELTFIDNIVVPQILIKHILSNKITILFMV